MHHTQCYVDNWAVIKSGNIGLLLCGGVGTGKSYIVGCVTNALMEQEVAIYVTNFARVMNELNSSFSRRNESIDRLLKMCVPVCCAGQSRQSEAAQEKLNRLKELTANRKENTYE